MSANHHAYTVWAARTYKNYAQRNCDCDEHRPSDQRCTRSILVQKSSEYRGERRRGNVCGTKTLIVSKILLRGHQRLGGYLQNTIGKSATLQEPFVDETNARRKQKPT